MMSTMLFAASVTMALAYEGRYDKRYYANSGYWDNGECKINDLVERGIYEDAVCDNAK